MRAALAVEDRLFRALAVLRVVVLANAVALNLYRGATTSTTRARGVVLLAVDGRLDGVGHLGLRRRRTPRPALLVADLAVALALLALTPVVKGPEFDASVPGFWVMAALLAWAVRYRLASAGSWRRSCWAGSTCSVARRHRRRPTTATSSCC